MGAILPLTIDLPSVGGKTPAKIFSNVDLPAPFLPIIATTSPEFSSKETPDNAT
jgi:hypothetical protein